MDNSPVEAAGKKEEKPGSIGSFDPTDWDSVLCMLLKNETSEPSTQALSEMASGRQGYGAACTCLYAIKQGKVSGVPFWNLDLSECTLSPRRIFVLLNVLPLSTEELKLGSSAVQGQALPLLRDFLEKVGTQQEGEGGGALRIKHPRFTERSVGRLEAPVVFSVLPSFLETLDLEGNVLGFAAMKALAQATRAGRLSCVRTLNLKSTRMNDVKMEILSLAFAEAKPLKIERLLLCRSEFLFGETFSSLLRSDTVPFLQELQLNHCCLSSAAWRALAERLKAGELPSLESLGLEWPLGWGWPPYELKSRLEQEAVVSFAGALVRSAVPRLKILNLTGVCAEQHAGNALVSALRSDEAPPLETVAIEVRDASEETARVLGGGEGLEFIRSLETDLEGQPGLEFLRGVMSGTAPKKPSWEELTLLVCTMDDGGGIDTEIWTALSDALDMGRLSSLHTLSFINAEHPEEFKLPVSQISDAEGGAGSQFCEVFRGVSLPVLSKVSLDCAGLTDRDLVWLGEGIRAGKYPQLAELSLCNNNFGRAGMEGVFGGVREAEGGLPCLYELGLECSFAGEGAASLAGALRSGKMPGLRQLRLRYTEWDDEGMRMLGEAVREGHMTRLEAMFLGGNTFGREGMDAFFGAVSASEKGFPSLQQLDLSGPSESDLGGGADAAGEGIAALSQSLRLEKMPCISDLGLSNCGLTNEGMRLLGEVFGEKDTQSLTELDLSHNPFDEEGLTSFLQALQPQSLPNLKRLPWTEASVPTWKKELIMNAKRAGKLRSLKSSS